MVRRVRPVHKLSFQTHPAEKQICGLFPVCLSDHQDLSGQIQKKRGRGWGSNAKIHPTSICNFYASENRQGDDGLQRTIATMSFATCWLNCAVGGTFARRFQITSLLTAPPILFGLLPPKCGASREGYRIDLITCIIPLPAFSALRKSRWIMRTSIYQDLSLALVLLFVGIQPCPMKKESPFLGVCDDFRVDIRQHRLALRGTSRVIIDIISPAFVLDNH